MTPFLTYELLTPETVDPVIMRITGQRERGFKEFRASNGVTIDSTVSPSDYYHYKGGMRSYPKLWIGSETPPYDDIRIPLADWSAVKQAIRELNESKKENDMKEDDKSPEVSTKEDRYEFDLREWEYDTEPEPFETTGPAKLIVRRKKSKVKVEWSNVSRFGDGMGENGIDFTRHGYERYHIVQFRVTGWDGKYAEEYTHYTIDNSGDIAMKLAGNHAISAFNMGMSIISLHFFYVGLDARDKWSAPVLLPESIYSKLDDICRALEQKANEVKG